MPQADCAAAGRSRETRMPQLRKEPRHSWTEGGVRGVGCSVHVANRPDKSMEGKLALGAKHLRARARLRVRVVATGSRVAMLKELTR
jgi:hypothetical protein